MKNELKKLRYCLQNNYLDVEKFGINKNLLLKEIQMNLSSPSSPVKEFRESLGLSSDTCPTCGRRV